MKKACIPWLICGNIPLTVITALALAPSGYSQNFTTSLPITTPVPNAGHNYIQDLNETVNPANGSVSIRIQAPVPDERGLNFPVYAYSYDSATQFTVTMDMQL